MSLQNLSRRLDAHAPVICSLVVGIAALKLGTCFLWKAHLSQYLQAGGYLIFGFTLLSIHYRLRFRAVVGLVAYLLVLASEVARWQFEQGEIFGVLLFLTLGLVLLLLWRLYGRE